MPALAMSEAEFIAEFQRHGSESRFAAAHGMADRTVHLNENEVFHSIPDHAAAFAEMLTRYARLIRAGRSAEDCARELLPIVRVAARRV